MLPAGRVLAVERAAPDARDNDGELEHAAKLDLASPVVRVEEARDRLRARGHVGRLARADERGQPHAAVAGGRPQPLLCEAVGAQVGADGHLGLLEDGCVDVRAKGGAVGREAVPRHVLALEVGRVQREDPQRLLVRLAEQRAKLLRGASDHVALAREDGLDVLGRAHGDAVNRDAKVLGAGRVAHAAERDVAAVRVELGLELRPAPADRLAQVGAQVELRLELLEEARDGWEDDRWRAHRGHVVCAGARGALAAGAQLGVERLEGLGDADRERYHALDRALLRGFLPRHPSHSAPH